MLIQLLFTDPLSFFTIVVAIIFALSIHEYFHAWMSYYLGDPTAKEQGRLTINPVSHLDPFGTLLLLTLGIGWGRPVPFNPFNLRNQKWGEVLVGLAGPASNLLMAIIIGLITRISPSISQLDFFPFLLYFVWINIVLGIFNLLPFPPLDGSHIFLNFLPPSWERVKITFLQGGPFLIIFVVFFMFYVGIPYICEPLFRLLMKIPLPL